MFNCEESQVPSKPQQKVLKTPKQFLEDIKRSSIENVDIDLPIITSAVNYNDDTFSDINNISDNDSLSSESQANDEIDKENIISTSSNVNYISTNFGDINADEIAHNPSVHIERKDNVVKRTINLLYFKNKHIFRNNYSKKDIFKPIKKPLKRGRKRKNVICSTCNKNIVKDVKSDGKPYRTCEKCKERKKKSYFKKHYKYLKIRDNDNIDNNNNDNDYSK